MPNPELPKPLARAFLLASYYVLVLLTLAAGWAWSEGRYLRMAARPAAILPTELTEPKVRAILEAALAREPGLAPELLVGGRGVQGPLALTVAIDLTARRVAFAVAAFEEARRQGRRTGPLLEWLRAQTWEPLQFPGIDGPLLLRREPPQKLPAGLLNGLMPLPPEVWLHRVRVWLAAFALVASAGPLAWAALFRWRRLLPARGLLAAHAQDGPGLQMLVAYLGLTGLGLLGLFAHTDFSLSEQEARLPADLALRHLMGIVAGLALFLGAAALNRKALVARRWHVRGWGFSLLEVLAVAALVAGLGLQQAAAALGSQQFLQLRGGILLLFAIPVTVACLAARLAPGLDVREGDLRARPWRRPLRTILALGAVAVPLGVTALCLAVIPHTDAVKDRGPLVQMAWALLAGALMLLRPDARREVAGRTWLHRAFHGVVALAAFALIFAPWIMGLRASAAPGVRVPAGQQTPLLRERLLARNVTQPAGVKHWDQAMRNWYEIASGGWTGAGPGQPVRAAKNAHKDFVPALLAGTAGALGGAASALLLGLFLLACWRRARQEGDVADPMGYLAALVGVTVVAASLQSWAGTLALWPSSGVITPFASFGTAGLLVYAALAGLAAAPAAPGGAVPWRWPGLGFLAKVLGGLLALTALGHGLLVLQRQAILATSIKDPFARPGEPPLILSAPQLPWVEAELQAAMGPLLERRRRPLVPGPGSALALVLGGRDVHGNAYQSSLERDSWAARLGLAEVLQKGETLAGRGVWFGRWLPALQRPREQALAAVLVGNRQPRPVPVLTSLDAGIQEELEEALAQELDGGSLRGEAVVLDAGTGALRAVATFEPEGELPGGLTPLFERRRFGSAIKGIVAYEALRAGVASAREPFLCTGATLRLDHGRVIEGRCKATDPRTGAKRSLPHGAIAGLDQALERSCNNFHILLMSRLIARLGPAGVAARFRAQGIPLEAEALARHETDWITAAFGDGPMEGTVYDLAQAYARLYQTALGGAAPQTPGMLDFSYGGWKVKDVPPAPTPAEGQAAQQVLAGLGRVLRGPQGTALRFGRQLNPAVAAWAKTGTSERPGARGAVKGFTAWFALIVQLDECLVVVVRLPDGGFQNLGSRQPTAIAEAFLRLHAPGALRNNAKENPGPGTAGRP